MSNAKTYSMDEIIEKNMIVYDNQLKTLKIGKGRYTGKTFSNVTIDQYKKIIEENNNP